MPKINLGYSYNQAKEECNKLLKTLDTLNNMKKDPNNFIFGHISKLKNQVDLRKEKIKKEIDDLSGEMIKKLEVFEKECYENTKNIKSSDENEKIIREAQATFDEWESGLTLMIADDTKRNEIQLKVKELDIKLLEIKSNFEKELLKKQVWIHSENKKVGESFSKELYLFENRFF